MDMQGGRGPSAVSDTEVLEGLNDLLQLDHDAIGAYEIAIEKLEDRDHAEQIRGFKAEHERHIRDLNQMIQALGGTPVNEPHGTAPLKQAMQSLGALAGDKGALIAWRTNELQVRTKYDNYASKANFWPAEVKLLIDRNALDEERHYQWVTDVLERMGVGAAEGAETGAATRLREQAGRVSAKAEELTGQAREQVTAAMSAARERASGGRDAAMERREELEERVRTQPVQTLLATFAIGFVIGRILR